MAGQIYLLDTNVISEMFKPFPNEEVLEKLRENEDLCVIASTVWNELMYGVQIMDAGKKRDFIFSKLVDEVQAKFPILPYDSHAAWIHADLRSRLKDIGKQVELADTQISSIAISNQMILVSRNEKHFEPIKEVSSVFYLQNWFSPVL